MTVAILAVHARFGFFVQDKGFEPALTYVALVLVLAFTGYGAYSLDSLLGLAPLWSPTLAWGMLALGLAGGLGSVVSRRRLQVRTPKTAQENTR